MYAIMEETPADAAGIETLLDSAFGLQRRTKASYRLRRDADHRPDLALVARVDDALVGTIRYWPILVDAAPALLLGPLGVEPSLRGRGIGRALIRESLALVDRDGRCPVLLVGDLDYYGAVGFGRVAPRVSMPFEAPERLLGREPVALIPAGVVGPAPSTRSASPEAAALA